MPTYEYECDACGYGFEKFQSMTDTRLKKCPECKKLKLHRLIGTGGGIIFKGTGFYETDFKTKKEPPKQESSSSSKGEKPQKTSKKEAVKSKGTKE